MIEETTTRAIVCCRTGKTIQELTPGEEYKQQPTCLSLSGSLIEGLTGKSAIVWTELANVAAVESLLRRLLLIKPPVVEPSE